MRSKIQAAVKGFKLNRSTSVIFMVCRTRIQMIQLEQCSKFAMR